MARKAALVSDTGGGAAGSGAGGAGRERWVTGAGRAGAARPLAGGGHVECKSVWLLQRRTGAGSKAPAPPLLGT